MKNKLMITVMMIFIIIAHCTTIFASGESINLKTESTEVKAGKTFSVKINVSASGGINGVATTYSYDTEKLELVTKKVLDSNFTDLGGATDNEIAIMFNPEDLDNFTEVIEADIYELTFKVKDNAKDKATISLGETDLSTLSVTNSEQKLPGDEVTVTILNGDAKQSSNNYLFILISAIIIVSVIYLVKANKHKNSM